MKKLFYKYKSCAGDLSDLNSKFYYLIDSLEKKYFYLTRPQDLNDKDEVHIYDKYNASYDDISKWLEKHSYLKQLIQSKIGSQKDPVYEMRKNAKKSDFFQVMEDSKNNERDHFHIFSLTDDSANQKMWKDYANNYDGICLGFEAETILENTSFFTDRNERFFLEIKDDELGALGTVYKLNGKNYLGLIEVSYVRKKPIYCNIFKLNESSEREKMKQSFLEKNNYNDSKRNKIDWSYEKESRIILIDEHFPRNEKIDIFAHYPDCLLKEVLIGHNVSQEKRDKILNVLNLNYSNYKAINIRTV